MFFSIPPDVFHSMTGSSANVDGSVAGEALDAPPGNSIIVRGYYVDTVLGLIDLAVDSGLDDGLCVFFAQNGGYLYIN